MKTATSDLLARAKRALQSTRLNYRDGMLSCGRLLHEFILAQLRQGDGMGDVRRKKAGFTRARAIHLAEEELKLSRNQVHILVKAAMAVDLLGDGQGPGLMNYRALFAFGQLLRRQNGNRRSWTEQRVHARISQLEQWQVYPEVEEEAKGLFRQAAAEGWTRDRTRDACRELRAKCPDAPPGGTAQRGWQAHPEREARRPMRQRRRESVVPHEVPLSVMSTGDLAEEIIDMVRRSSDPWAVAQRLIPHLQKIRRKEPAFAG